MKYLENIEELINNNNYDNFFLDFTASWCGPCKFITPKLEELSEMEKFKHVKFYKIDVDDDNCSDVCEKYGITCMPTLIYLKDNEVVDKIEGANIGIIEEKLIECFGLYEPPKNEEKTEEQINEDMNKELEKNYEESQNTEELKFNEELKE